MGYYVRIDSSNFVVPESPEVLAAIHDMDTRFDDIKRGGSFSAGTVTERWFSWMPPDLSQFKSVADVLRALGFEIDEGDGQISVYGYDNKTGQEDLFLAVMAPFVKDGSYIEWVGEEGERWRNVVHNGRLTVQYASLTWGEPQQYRHHSFRFDNFGEGGTHIQYTDPYADSTSARAE